MVERGGSLQDVVATVRALGQERLPFIADRAPVWAEVLAEVLDGPFVVVGDHGPTGLGLVAQRAQGERGRERGPLVPAGLAGAGACECGSGSPAPEGNASPIRPGARRHGFSPPLPLPPAAAGAAR